jgi:Zinc dependent phospholipase C
MKASLRSKAWKTVLLLPFVLCSVTSQAYSVLTHEELIDLAWNDSIRPLLLAKFPGATERQLVEAHAYAYGGCAIQDMGYYPFSKPLFSNLTHYVRSGDFVSWLLDNARTINELAFAIGALSHYLGDSIGHSEAINPATALNFPKLKDKFGASVTYGESPHGHIRTEFAFDIYELTDAAFAPPAYLKFIGFKVPSKYLERAFASTYGFELHEVLGKAARPALRSYRTSVRSFIPAFAEGEVVLHRNQFPAQPDDPEYHKFMDRVQRTNYERRWKRAFRGPGFKAHLIAALIFIVPKVAAASDLAIKIPTQETELRYLRSVNHTVDVFRENVQRLAAQPDPALLLSNLDLDTGVGAKLGEYSLADQAHEHLLGRLTSHPQRVIPRGVKENLIQYYKDRKDGSTPQPQLKEKLEVLRAMKTK